MAGASKRTGSIGRTGMLAGVLMAALSPSASVAATGASASQAGAQAGAAISYVVRRSGPADGPHPGRNSAVKLQYEGRFPDGTVFDDGQGKPVIFPVRAVVPGFQQALLMMRAGDEWEVTIPPDLAYGREGSPMSGRTLIFRISLIEVGKPVQATSPVLSEMPR